MKKNKNTKKAEKKKNDGYKYVDDDVFGKVISAEHRMNDRSEGYVEFIPRKKRQ